MRIYIHKYTKSSTVYSCLYIFIFEEILEKIVEKWTMEFTTKELVELLDTNAMPCAPIQGINEVMNDPHVKERNSIIEFDYPEVGMYPSVAFVPKFSTIDTPVNRPPTLGENNKEVYCDILGYTDEEFNEMKEKKLI